MTPLKTRIVQVIRRAGPDGISLADLYGIIYADRRPPLPAATVLKVHIWQLRRWHGVPIQGQRGGGGGYRMRGAA
jgi:hypothetical protein